MIDMIGSSAYTHKCEVSSFILSELKNISGASSIVDFPTMIAWNNYVNGLKM